MGLEAATYVADLNTSNPASSDLRSQGDDHLRLIKTVLQNTFPGASRAFAFDQAVPFSANDTLDTTTENHAIAVCDAAGGAFTLTLPTLAAGDEGWWVIVKKTDSSANAITIAGTIEGLTNYVLRVQYEWVALFWTGSIWAIVGVSELERTVAKTGSTTLTTTELNSVILVTPAATTTLTLPTAVGIKGKWYKIKKTSTGPVVTLDGAGSETIDGATTMVVFNYEWVKIVSDGANWFVAEYGGRGTAGRPGSIQEWLSDTLPDSRFAVWANGVAISRTTYADAFAVCGTVYGAGDGSTTFNPPDRCGRVGVGTDDMGGVSSKNRLTGLSGGVNADTLGATGGLESHTLTEAQLPVVAGHTHAANHDFHSLNTSAGSLDVLVTVAETSVDGTDSGFNTGSGGGFGSGSAHNNVQPTIVVNYIMWV